mgnify:CR=1 FL=1
MGLRYGDLVPFRYPELSDALRLSRALFVLTIRRVALCAIPHAKVAGISTHLHDGFSWALLLSLVGFLGIMRRQLLGCLESFLVRCISRLVGTGLDGHVVGVVWTSFSVFTPLAV